MMPLSLQYGGANLSLVECALVTESLAFGCTGMQTAMEGQSDSGTLAVYTI